MKKNLVVHLFIFVFAITISLIFVFINPASANEFGNKYYELNDIVVTGSSIPGELSKSSQSIAVIGREDIEASAVENVSDLLELVGGVDVRKRGVLGVQSDVSIRGSSFEQTLILIDGININDSQTGHHNMDIPVNLEDIERIEILKGPGARVYGQNAMAGVINIITRDGDQNLLGGHVKYGDYDYSSIGANFSGKAGQILNRISFSRQASSGYIKDEETDFDIKTMNYKGKVKNKDSLIEMGLGFTDKDFGAYKFYSDVFPDQRERTSTFLTYLNAGFKAGGVEIRPKIFWRHHEDDYKIQINGPWFYNNHKNDSYGFQLGSGFDSSLGKTAFGCEIGLEDITSSNLGDHSRGRSGLFLEHKFFPYSRAAFGLGASLMKYDEWGWEYWPGADVNISLTRGLSFFASASKSFRIPSYTELYYYTPANQGNPDLKPEKAATSEAGLRCFKKGIQTNISLFYRDAKNIIDWSRPSSKYPWKADNIAESKTRGFELSADLLPQMFFKSTRKDMALNFSYTFLDSEFDANNFESKYVLDHLKHQVAGSLFFNWTDDVSQTISVRYEKRMNNDSHVTADSRLTYKWKWYEFFLGIANIFNEDYIEAGFAPAPGRWIITGARFNVVYF